MGRRSRQYSDIKAASERTAVALDRFARLDPSVPLRIRVQALTPVAHGVRDLGSSLLPGQKSGFARILQYLRLHVGQVVPESELFVVAGIDDWARRLRELRVEHGWPIYSGVTFREIAAEDPDHLTSIEGHLGYPVSRLKTSEYVLLEDRADQHAASHWKLLKTLRNSKAPLQDRLLALLRNSVGEPISGEQFRYIAGKANEWPRRLRELRTEEGWPVQTRMQGRFDLPVGSYVLAEDRQAEPHDRKISDSVRSAVLKRDGYACRHCGWSIADRHPSDKKQFLELHHLVEHAAGGENSVENLVTLCNVDHDDVHARRLDLPAHWDEAK
jgi:hypothetical protein